MRLKAALSIIDKADKLEAEVLALAGTHVKANTGINLDFFAVDPH